MRKNPILLASILFVTLTGCTAHKKPCTGTPVPFTAVFDQNLFNSGISGQTVQVIRNQETLDQVWAQLQTGTPQPSIDFDTKMAILVTSGQQPNGCHDVRVTSIQDGKCGLVVAVEETVPGPTCSCTLALEWPTTLVTLGKSSDPVSSLWTQRQVDCQ